MDSPSKKSGDVGGDAFSGVFQKESWGLLPLLTPPPLALFFSSSGKEPSDELEVYRSVFGGKSRLLFARGAFIGPAGVFPTNVEVGKNFFDSVLDRVLTNYRAINDV